MENAMLRRNWLWNEERLGFFPYLFFFENKNANCNMWMENFSCMKQVPCVKKLLDFVNDVDR